MIPGKMGVTAGARLGDYEILEPLGSGGMGEVFRARDSRLGRLVAVKVLPPDVAQDPDRRARFEREARAVAALSHSNIVAIHELGSKDGVDFLVMELLEGESLRERLAARALPVRKALEYGVQIAKGLAAAHEKGIIHRDLKPENLFVTAGGEIKILDFGLARQSGAAGLSDASHTRTRETDPGTVLGTVGYMSPEQVRGGSIDQRSDIFSMGCVLYEMLTGLRAFKRDTAAETMSAILRDEPREAPTESGPLNPGVDRIVRHCLEKTPTERFQSARDLAFDLQTTLAGTLGSQPGITPLEPTPRKAFLTAAVAVAALAALLGLAVGYALARRLPTKPAKDLTFTRLTFSRGTIHNARFAPDGKTVIFGAAWEGQPIKLFLTRSGSSETTPVALPDAELLSISSSGELAVSLGHTFFGWLGQGTLARTQLLGGSVRPLSENVREADWTPDGSALAVVRRVNGRERLEFPVGTILVETGGYLSHVRFSPKGDRIAFEDHPMFADDFGSVAVVDVPSGKKTTLTRSYATVRGIAWPPSGDEVWFTATSGGQPQALRAVDLFGRERLVLAGLSHLLLYDIARDGQVLLGRETPLRRVEALGAGSAQPMTVSMNREELFGRFITPDGQAILFTDQYPKGYVTFLQRADGSLPISLGEGDGFELSPDGRWAVALTPEAMPRILLHPTGPGDTHEVPNPSHLLVSAAGWLRDSRSLVVVGRTPTERARAYVLDTASGAARPFTPEGLSNSTLNGVVLVSPDNARAVGRDEEGFRVYHLDGSAPESLPGLEARDVPLEWTEDGHGLFVGHREGTSWHVLRYDPRTGKQAPWTTVAPVEPAGLRLSGLYIAPNGRYWVHSYSVLLTDLYFAGELR